MKQHDNTTGTQCLNTNHHDYVNSRVITKSSEFNSTSLIFSLLIRVASCDGDPEKGSKQVRVNLLSTCCTSANYKYLCAAPTAPQQANQQ